MGNHSMSLVGTYAPLQLGRCVPSLVSSIAAGRLKITQGTAIRFLWFGGGRVLSVTSALEEERLGAWLVNRGLVDRASLWTVLTAKLESERLGQALVKGGLIDSVKLQGELELLGFKLAARLAFEQGDYIAEAGSILPDDALTLYQAPLPFFARAVRRAQDSGQFETLVGGGRKWMTAPGIGPDYQDEDLDPLDRFLLSSLQEAQTLVELQAKATHQTHEVPRSLACLAVLGLVIESASDLSAAAGFVPAYRREKPNYPPASPRLRELLGQIDPAACPKAPTAQIRPEDIDKAEQNKLNAYGMLRGDGDPRAAHKLLLRAVEIIPDATALTILAELEMANPLWRGRALERLKQAVALAPQHTPAWLLLANYWSVRGAPDKQMRCLEKLLSYDPRHAEARETLELLNK